jgi:hypothetical protein
MYVCMYVCMYVRMCGCKNRLLLCCIMRSLTRSSWLYWSGVECDGRATVVVVGWRRCCLEDCWECCSSLRLAWWDVLFNEARWRQRVHLAGTHLSLSRPAPVAGYIATSRMCRANAWTALLELNVLTGPCHLGNWSEAPCWLECLPVYR